MDNTIKSGQVEKLKADCVVVGVYSKNTLGPNASKLNKTLNNAISMFLKDMAFKASPGDTLLLPNPQGISAKHVLLLGMGDPKDLSELDFNKACKGAIQALKPYSFKDIAICMSDLSCTNRTQPWGIRAFIIQLGAVYYDYNEFKSKDSQTKIPNYTFNVSSKREVKAAEEALNEGQCIVMGMKVTKDLGNCPANVCTPTYLANFAKKMATKYEKISTAILSEKDMQALKMGSLLSVTKGAATPAKLITMEYRGGKKQDKPYVLVGKGITFDTGGNSLKPANSMIGMKYDMCGGATVLGTLKAIAELKLPLNVIGVVPACENTPGGDATRPDDIVTSMSGQTIEILNTDAEGRLILADALTYVERYKPKVVIDMATLTGACVVAFGNLATAVMSNDDKLASTLLKAGNDIFDRAWQLPLWDDYHDSLKSNFADMKNIGDGGAGTITAGCFLAKFTQKYTWAHLDIAGSAAHFSGDNRGATGRPVPMLVQYLLNEANA